MVRTALCHTAGTAVAHVARMPSQAVSPLGTMHTGKVTFRYSYSLSGVYHPVEAGDPVTRCAPIAVGQLPFVHLSLVCLEGECPCGLEQFISELRRKKGSFSSTQ